MLHRRIESALVQLSYTAALHLSEPLLIGAKGGLSDRPCAGMFFRQANLEQSLLVSSPNFELWQLL